MKCLTAVNPVSHSTPIKGFCLPTPCVDTPAKVAQLKILYNQVLCCGPHVLSDYFACTFNNVTIPSGVAKKATDLVQNIFGEIADLESSAKHNHKPLGEFEFNCGDHAEHGYSTGAAILTTLSAVLIVLCISSEILE